jgi:hypothetical protein
MFKVFGRLVESYTQINAFCCSDGVAWASRPHTPQLFLRNQGHWSFPIFQAWEYPNTSYVFKICFSRFNASAQAIDSDLETKEVSPDDTGPSKNADQDFSTQQYLITQPELNNLVQGLDLPKTKHHA